MSKTVKKKASSMSYSLNKLYRRISTMELSTFILSIIVIAIAVFLFGGGIYDLIMRPYPAIYSNSTGLFILVDPRLSEQFISDSIVATMLYALGVIGLITIYQSTKYAYKPRQAYMMFVLGTVLLFLAYTFLEATIKIKTGG
jgi:tryptophan-rich sensory protein